MSDRIAHKWIEGFRVPILVVQAVEGVNRKAAAPEVFSLLLKADIGGYEGRGVSGRKLSHVLKYGVDVYPTTSPIYVETGVDKALEYGCDEDQLIMMFDGKALDATWREVSASIDHAELQRLRQVFPTLLKSRDGSKLWLSRLKEGDPKCSSPYEVSFARWLPGDPWSALKAVVWLSEAGLAESERRIHEAVGAVRSEESGRVV